MLILNLILTILILLYLFWKDYLGKHLKIAKYSKEIDVTWWYKFNRYGEPTEGTVLYSYEYRRQK